MTPILVSSFDESNNSWAHDFETSAETFNCTIQFDIKLQGTFGIQITHSSLNRAAVDSADHSASPFYTQSKCTRFGSNVTCTRRFFYEHDSSQVLRIKIDILRNNGTMISFLGE